MSGWAGFSDEELRRIQQNDSAVPAAATRARQPAAASRSRQQLQRERALRLAAEKHRGAPPPSLPPPGLPPPGLPPPSLPPPGLPPPSLPPPGLPPPGLPPGQQLVGPPPTEERVPQAAAPTGAPAVGLEAEQRAAELEPAAHQQGPGETRTVKELDPQEVDLREKSRLEQLQQEQKKMEETNRRRKALLAKTIAEKSKQTQAEAVKLRRIQKELQALDDMVSNDIGILRNLIEEASWDYSTTRKRYEKAEAEYVSAKLDLHRRTEVKEQLTEHLCTIIQQNELRKAQKLEELMQQLQLPPTEEEEEEQRSTAAPENQGAPPKDEQEEQRGTAAPENQGAPPKDEQEEQRGGEAPAEEDGGSLGEQREALAS